MSAAGDPAGTIAFMGLGQMGLPMARRLMERGYAVRGSDLAGTARDVFAACRMPAAPHTSINDFLAELAARR